MTKEKRTGRVIEAKLCFKKYLAVLLSITIMLSVTGCGENSSQSVDQNTTESVSTTEVISEDSDNAETETSSVETEIIETETTESGEIEDSIAEENITQKNSIAMLNNLMVITEKIKQSNNSKLYLEEVGNAMLNDFYPNAIDKRTQTQIGDLYRLVNSMRMIDIKRERLVYIYDQNKAQAIMSAVPSPMAILNVVQATNPLKAIASVVYVAVDSAKSYESATYANEIQYLQDGWDLDDEMDTKLSALNLDAFNYSQDIVDEYGIEGDLTLSQDMAKVLVEWENNENVSRRIAFLNNHQEEYKACGHYWLLLSRSYYENNDYAGCVEAMNEYLDIQPRLFRRDVGMAKILPFVIASLDDVYSGHELIERQQFYVQLLSNNVATNDWASRYYAALTYMDLYAKTKDTDYLQKAYEAAKTNVNEVKSTINDLNLIDYQLSNNKVFLDDIKEVKASKTATSDEKKEIKSYNKMLKEVRKTELAPIDNALLLNVKLMIDLAHELNLPEDQLKELDNMIHGNNSQLFLVDSIDANLWASKTVELNSPDVSFDGEKITVPANYVCAESIISVSVNGKSIDRNQKWIVDSVKRKGNTIVDYVVTYANKNIKKIKFEDGDIVTISIQPYEEYFDALRIDLKVNVSKKLFITSYSFEKIDQ